jgi:predicted alpha/beta hydrolase family esterase
LHGWESHRPREHWHWWLTEELRRRGEQVLYPQLPAPDTPTLADWLAILHAELAQLGDGERIVVAHSMSCQLWLHAASELSAEERVDRVLLVAAPDPTELARYDPVVDFAITAPDSAAVAQAAGTTRFVCSSDDPWTPHGVPYADLGLPVDVIHGGGHLNPDSGYGPWPALLRWCLEATTPVGPR